MFNVREYFTKKESSANGFMVMDSRILEKNQTLKFNATFSTPDDVKVSTDTVSWLNNETPPMKQVADIPKIFMKLVEVESGEIFVKSVPVNKTMEMVINGLDFRGNHGVIGFGKENKAQNNYYDTFDFRFDPFIAEKIVKPKPVPKKKPIKPKP